MDNKKLLGQRIKEVRKSFGFTQERLAESIGIETGSLSAIESGRHFPSLITLEKVANTFNLQLQVFFEFHDSISERELRKKIQESLSTMGAKELISFSKVVDYYKTLGCF